MNCPKCHNDKINAVKDRLAVEAHDSTIRQSIHPGERPSAFGNYFIILGAIIGIIPIILINSRAFVLNFWNKNYSTWDYLLHKELHLNTNGYMIISSIVLCAIVVVIYGLKMRLSFKNNIIDWDRKQRFVENGMFCSSCMTIWIPGLEDHSISIKNS